MGVLSPYVTNPGDFKWKPKHTISVDEDIPKVLSTTGTNVVKTAIIGSAPARSWELEFECSLAIYQEIYTFLRSKRFGGLEFTWRDQEINKLFTVRQAEKLKRKVYSDNTDNQDTLAVHFSLSLIQSTDVATI